MQSGPLQQDEAQSGGQDLMSESAYVVAWPNGEQVLCDDDSHDSDFDGFEHLTVSSSLNSSLLAAAVDDSEQDDLLDALARRDSLLLQEVRNDPLQNSFEVQPRPSLVPR
jgi:hypothetical protein